MNRPTPRWLARAVLTAALLLGATCTTATTVADESPVSADDLRADLDHLYEQLEAAHYDLFINRTRAEQDALHAELRASIDGPSRRLEAVRLLQRFAAFGDVAHARIDLPVHYWGDYRAAGGKALPIWPRIVDGRVVVNEHYAQGPDGAPLLRNDEEIVAIEGESIAVWLERLGRYHAADTERMLHALLEGTFARDLWLETGAVDALTLTLATVEGDRRTVRVPTLDRETLILRMDASPPRLTLDPGRSARIDGRIGILRPGPSYNIEDPSDPWDTSASDAFLDDAFERFLEAGVTDLLIDLRDHPGGDNSFTDPLVAWFATEPFRFASYFEVRDSRAAERSNAERLEDVDPDGDSVTARYARAYAETPSGETFTFEVEPVAPRAGERFTGDVWVLVNRRSYSNAVTTAALIQDHGFGRVIGEPTTDFATTLAAMETFTLPRTGVQVGFPKALIVRPSGDRTPGVVTPDVPIEVPIVTGTEDRLLARALRRIRGAGRE